jgi:hypothetical protein
MSKPLLLSILISTGVAAAALTALRLASEPQARNAASGDTVRVVTPALAVASSIERPASAAPSPVVVELAELRIRAPAPVRGSRKPHPEPPPAPDLIPCSDWREIGPVYSTRAGEAPRQRRVQLLCAAGSDR